MYLRRRFAFILLLGMSAPYWGVYTYLSLRQAENWKRFIEEREREEGKDQFVWLKLAKNEPIHWERADEFEYKGQMYDVWEKRDRGDSVWYRCRWDREDSEILRLKKSLRTMPSETNRSKEDWIQWYKIHLYVYNADQALLALGSVYLPTNKQIRLPEDPGVAIPEPPPRFLLCKTSSIQFRQVGTG